MCAIVRAELIASVYVRFICDDVGLDLRRLRRLRSIVFVCIGVNQQIFKIYLCKWHFVGAFGFLGPGGRFHLNVIPAHFNLINVPGALRVIISSFADIFKSWLEGTVADRS